MMTEKQWKYYRDIKNVTDTAFEEGEILGEEKKEIQIVLNMYAEGVQIELIARYMKIPVERVKEIVQQHRYDD